jgi:hypothetical protein
MGCPTGVEDHAQMDIGVQDIASWCKAHRHDRLIDQHAALCRKIRGHDAYYEITGNGESLQTFRFLVHRVWRRWLNQIEIVFGIVSRRVMRRGNFKSLKELKQRLLDFIDYFNTTFAKPFHWRHTGRPVRSDTIKRPSTWKENWAASRKNKQTSALVA